jgi:hypothetical protein
VYLCVEVQNRIEAWLDPVQAVRHPAMLVAGNQSFRLGSFAQPPIERQHFQAGQLPEQCVNLSQVPAIRTAECVSGGERIDLVLVRPALDKSPRTCGEALERRIEAFLRQATRPGQPMQHGRCLGQPSLGCRLRGNCRLLLKDRPSKVFNGNESRTGYHLPPQDRTRSAASSCRSPGHQGSRGGVGEVDRTSSAGGSREGCRNELDFPCRLSKYQYPSWRLSQASGAPRTWRP